MIESDQKTAAFSSTNNLADKAAFTALFCALYPNLLWYAGRFVSDAKSAEDLTQEAFIRLWERRTSLDTSRSVRALLYVTLRNLGLNHQRNVAAQKKALEQMAPPAPPRAPETDLDAHLLRQHLRTWIQALPERQREAFELSRFCGLSHREIASVMEVAVHTVEKHITFALRRLRDHLHDFDPDLLLS